MILGPFLSLGFALGLPLKILVAEGDGEVRPGGILFTEETGL